MGKHLFRGIQEWSVFRSLQYSQNYIDGIDAIDLPNPDLSLIIPDLNFSLSDGETELTSIEIANTGEPDYFILFIESIQFQNPRGPDLSENYWTDSNNEPNSNYQWIDISNNATLYNFPSNDDGELINIGFDFPFYNKFNDVLVIQMDGLDFMIIIPGITQQFHQITHPVMQYLDFGMTSIL